MAILCLKHSGCLIVFCRKYKITIHYVFQICLGSPQCLRRNDVGFVKRCGAFVTAIGTKRSYAFVALIGGFAVPETFEFGRTFKFKWSN